MGGDSGSKIGCMARKAPDDIIRILIKPISSGQRTVLRSLATSTVTICAGMAGTGKTHLAVATGIKSVVEGKTNRLIVCRPIVDSGEHLGYLPGDITEKTGPYMAPVFDILQSLLTRHQLEGLQQNKKIEVAPLAYMRGRTFTKCYMILDEAQNATLDQIRMFISRLGHGSQLVMCGDQTQRDIPDSGFEACIRAVENTEEVSVHYLTEQDMARHPLVTKILARLNEHNRGRK